MIRQPLLTLAAAAALLAAGTQATAQDAPAVWNGAALHLQFDAVAAAGSFYDADSVTADGTASAAAWVEAGPDATMTRGFGLGVERTLSWLCGLKHIRETIPFARTLGKLSP